MGDVWWEESIEVVVVVVVGGRGDIVLTAFCCFIATSAHYEEDNELGNFGRVGSGGGTFKSENKPHTEWGGVGR